VEYKRSDLLPFYQEMLTHLGGHAASKVVREIYAFPTTVFSHSENLRAVIDGIAKIDWHAISKDQIGDIYEGLLAKNSQDARSGAGQYFTPRALVDSIVRAVQPRPGELIQDPAAGSGGFLISADHYMRGNSPSEAYRATPPRYQGIEIEKSTYRICLMNTFLHHLGADIRLGDALTEDAHALEPANLILANPPFGARAGSRRKRRSDLEIATGNKQLAFLQHIYPGLIPGGRAAVVVPDNVLFEEGAGRRIRQMLMTLCDLHTVLRLPQGIFYSPGVQTNVLFFARCSSGTDATKTIAYYDMRTAAPRYGRKRPLVATDFAEFERVYTERPAWQDVPSGRWRSYSRAEIAARDDNLDVAWLPPEDTPGETESSHPLAVQANRVKKSCGDEACEEFVVPSRDLAPKSE
jgi:type I restriction enzyme M protein